jgi:AcrR family transcriptional regulator
VSASTNRKERERAAREELILDHGQRLLLRDGFQNLNLDQLAKAIEYSKGTIYLHFKTKEDLALAISTRALKERADLFERASQFTGKTRERIRAIGFACCEFAVTNRDFFNIEMMLKSTSFWEKSSEERRRQHGIQAGRLFQIVTAIVIEAVRCGDLPAQTRVTDVTLSLIAVTMGSHIAAMEPDLQMLFAIEDPLAVVRRNQDVICDGWGWKPLLNEWDYAATDRRIRAEIFPRCTWLRER